MSSLSCGIVGLPNVGKSTIFSALTNAAAESGNFPFTTINPNIAIVDVPDDRLDYLTKVFKPDSKIYTSLKFVDIAGLVKGASEGEGLGNKFLGNIREVDAVAHVLRCFEDDVTHVFNSVDPIRDMEVINLELCYSDIQILEKRILKLEKNKKNGDKDSILEYELVQTLMNTLNKGKRIDINNFDNTHKKIIRSLNLISSKPIIYVLNYGDNQIDNLKIEELKKIIKSEGETFVEIYGLLENEIRDLESNEKQMFLSEYNIKKTGLDLLINKAYEYLNLITFYTAGPKECRAWSIINHSKAPVAAGKIHSDFQKGFIKAEVIKYSDFVNAGSEDEAKKLGYLKSEGKDYIVEDGDMIHFRYNLWNLLPLYLASRP